VQHSALLATQRQDELNIASTARVYLYGAVGVGEQTQ